MRRRRAESLALVAIGLALAASACSSSQPSEGEHLTVFGNMRGADAEAFRAVLSGFEDATGIEVRFTGSASFPRAIRERVEEGNAPDVAMFPQPGLLADLANEGYVRPLRDDVAAAATESLLPSLGDAFGSVASVDGVLFQVNVKSLVWYRPAEFAARGYDVPSTWTQLEDLTARISAEGMTPWCMGVSAFDASGWPATDWVEDVVLRLDGTDVYDGWVGGIIPFTDGRIGSAVAEFGSLVLGDEQANGGRRGILNTTPARAQNPMFSDPPGCLMYKQASFQVSNLPPGTTVGEGGDVDVFVLPGRDPVDPPPILVGGTVAAAFTDSDATWALMRYLASSEAGEAWAARGGFVSPRADFDASAYASAFDRRMASIVAAADVTRFDGSDTMYSPVGTRSFFDAMIQYIATDRLGPSMETAQSGYSR
jgi:alpha-glucoside transport system substrate-binding protein